MGYERYPRGSNSPDDQNYGRDYGSGRDYTYSSARDYQAAGRLDAGRGGDQGGDRGGDRDRGREAYGARDHGNDRYGQREQFGRAGGDAAGRDRFQGGSDYYRGGQDRDQRYRQPEDRGQGQRGPGRPPQGRDDDDRGFFDRAGDEVRSWFGDEDAERRREMDSRYAEDSGRQGRTQHDDHYHSWRSGQIAALDRDYDEYRRENRSKFESEFSSWRTSRQGQRDQLRKVTEHQEVVGSDGVHVGTVDKVKGDRILLTKTDQDAGGQHHSIPCSWVQSVDDKVTLNKAAEDAKQAWRDEDRSSALFGYGDNAKAGKDDRDDQAGGNLNRSFSGTY